MKLGALSAGFPFIMRDSFPLAIETALPEADGSPRFCVEDAAFFFFFLFWGLNFPYLSLLVLSGAELSER